MAFNHSETLNRDLNYQNTIGDCTRILTQGEFMDNEMKMSERLFSQQNVLDEKITNNMLKINIVIYIFTLSLSTMVVFYSSDIFNMKPRDDKTSTDIKLTFSLFSFHIEGKGVQNATNPYSCILNTTTCENNCKNISIEKLKEIFPLECGYFSTFESAGIIVN
jgi:hypothetical protein